MLRDDPIIASDLAARELIPGRQNLPQLWGRRGFWQIRMRWAVAPILWVALASPFYNSFFAWIFSRYESRLQADPQLDRFFTILEVLADYTAMFLLLHFTGGVASPLIFFPLFHLIIAAIQFSPGTAYSLAGLAVGCLWILFAADVMGFSQLPHRLPWRASPDRHQPGFRGTHGALVRRSLCLVVWVGLVVVPGSTTREWTPGQAMIAPAGRL
ncbi:MAG: hypothetical protein WBO71_12365 [Thermoanaerobaculia bacterium]